MRRNWLICRAHAACREDQGRVSRTGARAARPGRKRRGPGLGCGGRPRRCDCGRGQELRRAPQRPDRPRRAPRGTRRRAVAQQERSFRLRRVFHGNAMPDVSGSPLLGAHSSLSQRKYARRRRCSKACVLSRSRPFAQPHSGCVALFNGRAIGSAARQSALMTANAAAPMRA